MMPSKLWKKNKNIKEYGIIHSFVMNMTITKKKTQKTDLQRNGSIYE